MPAITSLDLSNAKLDVDHIAAIATSTSNYATDRLGHTKLTMRGATSEIADAIYTATTISVRGDWVTATAYAIKDVVQESGTWYVCVVAHTSGATFAGDLATKWRVYQGVISGDLIAGSGSSLVGVIQPGTGAVLRTVEDRMLEWVTPQDFGADPTGVLDSGTALTNWLNYMVANPDLKYECIGKFSTSVPLVANFVGNSPCSVYWDCQIISTITTLSDIVTFTGSFTLQFNGILHITGNGGTTYSTRVNRNALVVNNCSRFSYDTIRVEYVLNHGLAIIGTTSQPSGKCLQAWYCGSSPADSATKMATTVGAVGARTSTSGSTTQTQQLSVINPAPPYVDSIGWFVKIRGALYKIVTINTAYSFQVYPWLSSAVMETDVVEYIGGAGYYSIGGDTSAGRLETLDALVCGIGFQSLSLYPTSVDNYVSQYSGIAMLFGSAIGSALTSCNVDYYYSENDVFGVVLASLATNQLRIGPTVGFPANRSFRMAPRLTDDSFSSTYQSLGAAFSYIDNSGIVANNGQAPRGSEFSNMPVTVAAGSVASYSFNNNSQTVTLVDPTTVNLITGLRAIDMTIFGSGANNQPTGTITVTPPASHDINGGAAGASVTFTSLTKPLHLRAIWIGGTSWRLSNDIFPKLTSQLDSVAATLPAMVTDFNALLAKLRAAGLM